MSRLEMSEEQYAAHQSRHGRNRATITQERTKAVRLPKPSPKRSALSYEQQLGSQLRLAGIECEVDVPYIPGRKVRADVLIEPARLVIEVQGMVHRIKDKWARDIIKAQLTILAGYRLLPVSTGQVRSGEAARLVGDVLGRAGA